MELGGLEPPTSWVRSRRSPKPSYSPAKRTVSNAAVEAAQSSQWRPTKVNERAVKRARQLIRARQYVLDSDWGDVQPDAEEENAFL